MAQNLLVGPDRDCLITEVSDARGGDVEVGPLALPAEDAGLDGSGGVILRVQREVSRQREAEAAAGLKAELSELSEDDARRESFMCAQRCIAARSHWTVIPYGDHRLKNRYYHEIIANTFGLASPAMAPWVGKRVNVPGNHRVDARGDVFFTVNRLVNKRGARAKWSKSMELEVRDALREADVPVEWQVRGLFEDMIRGRARTEHYNVWRRGREGIVPDIRYGGADGQYIVADVKTIGF